MPVARKRNFWIQQSTKDESFHNKYALGEELGRGKSSIIYKCERRGLKQTWAVKLLVKNTNRRVCMAEIGLLLGLDHENLVRLQEIFESKTRIFIVQQLVDGGELFDRIVTLTTYTEGTAAKAIKDVVSGINYLHNCGYVLRNLKPENLLYETTADTSRLKIADFALSSIVSLEVDMSSLCGSAHYTAPEILKGTRYGKAGDMWSVGVIIYILLCGYEPFNSDIPAQLFKKIIKGKFEFVQQHWEHVSVNAQDIISKLLVLDPVVRVSASAALRTVWVQGSVPKTEPLDSVVDRIRDFNERRRERFRTGQLEVHTIHPNTNPRFLQYV